MPGEAIPQKALEMEVIFKIKALSCFLLLVERCIVIHFSVQIGILLWWGK